MSERCPVSSIEPEREEKMMGVDGNKDHEANAANLLTT